MRNPFYISILLLLCCPLLITASTLLVDVLSFGAVGNGVADDTSAFAKAWERACTSSSSPWMRVPSGKTFLIRPLRFDGPCRSNSVIVEIDGNVVAPSDPSNWRCEGGVCHQWLYFHRVDGLRLRGAGTLDGRGHNWWQNARLNRPTLMEISNAENVQISGNLRFKNSPMMHLVLNGIQPLYVSGVTIEAPENSPNTDGIHLQFCTNAHVDNCKIGTGDDCIAIVDGSRNLRIRNITCGPGHGISIGSLGKHGAENKVEDVRVSDVVFSGTTNGARIKTWQGGRGYARDIHFERFVFRGTTNPIIIDQFYCDRQLCTPSKSAVEISNVSYKTMMGISRSESAVELRCSAAVPCRDIVVEDLHIVTAAGKAAAYGCTNVYGRAQGHQLPKISSCFN